MLQFCDFCGAFISDHDAYAHGYPTVCCSMDACVRREVYIYVYIYMYTYIYVCIYACVRFPADARRRGERVAKRRMQGERGAHARGVISLAVSHTHTACN